MSGIYLIWVLFAKLKLPIQRFLIFWQEEINQNTIFAVFSKAVNMLGIQNLPGDNKDSTLKRARAFLVKFLNVTFQSESKA